MRRPLFSLLLLVVAAGAASHLWAQRPAEKPARVPPPKKFKDDVLKAFAPNPRRLLQGERPQFGTATAVAVATPGGGNPVEAASAGGGGSGWSALISADVLADEIKAQQAPIAEQVSSLSTFNGGGYRKLRTHFSMLAVSFGIIAEYDGDVRWKDQAAGVRDAFARVGFNTKVGTDASFNESKLRLEDLEALIRGGSVDAKEPEGTVSWDKISGRPPLMTRLELAQQERLSKWTASQQDFEKNADGVIHEAQIVAALAEVIHKEEFEYWDDETYVGYCEEMKKAALEAADGAKQNNYDKVRTAVGVIGQACSNCHDDYRS